MTSALRPRYSLDEYVSIEDGSIGVKHEYVRGEIYAMAGGSPEHAALASALGVLVGSALRGRPCRTYSSDLRIAIAAAETYTYADFSVVCDPVERDPSSPTHVSNPTVVAEVMSPSSERYDREQKRLYYQQIASLQTYLLVAQESRRIEAWHRNGDQWACLVHGPGDEVELRGIDVNLSVDELYDAAGL